MYTVTQRLIQDAPTIHQFMQYDPRIGLNLAAADVPMVLVVMFCLMIDGVDTGPAIYRYLSERGCKFDRATIDFFLDQYDGDDPQHHLWTRGSLGDYFPLYELLSLPDITGEVDPA